MNKNDNLIIFKPNELIEIVGYPISSLGILTYNFLLHKFQTLKTDNLLISADEIFKNIDILNNHDELYRYLDILQKIRIESRDKKGRIWGAFNLLAVFQKKDDGIFVQIPIPIYKVLCGNGDKQNQNLYYTAIRLLEQRAFKCSYSLIFYEIFKKYEKINIPIFILSELKELTGTENKYKEYKDFKRYVLEKVLKELNQFDSKYEYSFEEKRLGRKVHEIKFIRTEKNTIDISSEPQMSEKLLNAITKARKNQYIDSVYSQKALDTILTMYEEKDIIKGLNELYKYNSEIKNFSKILISKIEDIKNSKLENLKKKKEKKQEPIEESINSTEPIESNLEIEKEKISFLILQSKHSMTQRLNLMTQLVEIHSLEELLEFKNKI
ncbi:MAG: replication initiation protein [Cetobacterium sp.]|nr:replication initiation protein [Cetobacterium sp.]